MIRILHFFGQRLRREDGMALMLSLGAMMALGLFSASSLLFTTQNSGQASRSKADQTAFALAEAGINNAMAIISNSANDPTNASLLPSTTLQYDGGTVTWSGTYDQATSTWTLTATGLVRNPTGPDATPVQRVLRGKATVSAGPQALQPLANDGWNYVISTRTGTSCDQSVSASAVVSVPLYAFGNLCLGASATVTTGPLSVRGSATVGAGAGVGLLGTPISEAHIAGGCSGHACTVADRVYANTLDQSPPNLIAPVADWDYWYDNAAPGPKHRCENPTGTEPVFDNNSVRDKSVPTVFSLTPASSYTCRVGAVGNPTGELSWNATTRVLTVTGTIFFDGQAKIDNGRLNTYTGQGVIYTSGAFAVANGSKMCAVVLGTDCDFTPGVWDPNTKLLAVVSNGSGGIGVLAGNSIQIGCLDRLQGGLYATNVVSFTAGASPAKHQGPIVASTIVLSAAAELKPFGRLSTVPSGLPGQPRPRGGVGPLQNFSG
jgi:hypothetical protein